MTVRDLSRTASLVATFAGLMALGALGGCDRLPGQPVLAERWTPATEVTDFSRLYARNCSGCHGADGRLGAARPLDDPLYLALVGEDTLRGVIARGVPGTSMPAFAQAAGGSLTDQQIDILVKEMRGRWARPEEFKNTVFPPYSAQEATAMGSGPGNAQHGAATYTTYCAQCHGADGGGEATGGSVTDPAYLALASDQALRTAVIAGRPDLGKPDWRANLPGRPLSPQDISDVVAWLVAQRATGQAARQE
jgi:cytochrome c oxidase cbb3-type subunit 3